MDRGFCERKVRGEIAQSIVLAGGSTLFTGLGEKAFSMGAALDVIAFDLQELS